MLLRLAYRNILRNSRRSLLTAGGVGLCVAFLLVAMTHLYGLLSVFEEDLLVTTGHIRVIHPEYEKKQRLMSLRWNIKDSALLARRLRALPGVVMVVERLNFAALVDTDGEHQYPVVCVAFDPSSGFERKRFDTALSRGELSAFDKACTGKVKRAIIGRGIAEKLGLGPGSLLTLIVRTRTSCISAGAVAVKAVVDMKAGQLNRLVYIPLPDVRRLLEMEGRATDLLVFASRGWGLNSLAEKVRKLVRPLGLAAFAWYETGLIGAALNSLYMVVGIVFGVLLFVAGIGVGNTMVMAVLERTTEIGVLGALGFSRKQIVLLFLLEGLILGLMGALPGACLGMAGSAVLQAHGIDVKTHWAEKVDFPVREVIYGRLAPESVFIAFALGLIVTVLASIGPSLRASRLAPADALRPR